MANELIINYPTGSTLYALLFDATGQVWNGAAFAAPGSANWTDYDIAMSEVATATGIYRGSMPAAAAGVYSFAVRKQAGGSPAVADIAVGVGHMEWDGAAEVSLTSRTKPADTQAAVTLVATTTNLTNAPTVGDLTAAMKLSVNAEVDTALSDIKLDHLVAVADSDDVADNAIIAKLASKAATADWSGFTNTTDALEAIRDTAPLGTAMRGTDGAELSGAATAALVAANLDHLVGTATGIPTLPAGTFLDGVAKPGADSDTLKTLSDQLDAIEGATEVGMVLP